MVPRLRCVVENRGVGILLRRRLDDLYEALARVWRILDETQGLVDITTVMLPIVEGHGLCGDVRCQGVLRIG